MIRKDTTFQLAQLKSPVKQKSTVVDARAIEYLKCKTNPLYYGQNYVYVEETGGALKLTPDKMHNKVRRVVRSLYKYHNCVFMASRQLGKALDISTPILRADGSWATMSDLQAGEMIFDDQGNPTKVLATTQFMYNHTCYQLEFSNGEKIIADKDHQWLVHSKIFNMPTLLTSQILFDFLSFLKEDFWIESPKPIQISSSDLAVNSEYKIQNNFLKLNEKQRFNILNYHIKKFSNFNQNDCIYDISNRDPLFIKRFKILLSSLGISYIVEDNKIKFQIKNNIENKILIKSVKKVNSVPVKCIAIDSPSKLFLAGHSLIPTHNSTIAAIMIDWAMNFYARIPCVILNMKKNAALKNLERIKFIHDNLPDWMRVPATSKSDIKTYFTLKNDSRVDVYYPSTVHDPSTLARSLTIPILYIDEAAFISNMRKIFGSAQQTLSKAREQAIKWNYPYMIFVTSTPNGIYGDGEWFYKRYTNAVESDDLFFSTDDGYEFWREDIDIDARVKDKSKNGFIRVKYHWSEDPTKDQEWYEQQCRELDDERMINQELDLIFVGSSTCIFSDQTLSQFKKQKYILINFPETQVDMKLFKENLDPLDYYLIGVDTASSTKGAFDSIEIFTFKNFEQIAEINVKLGSLTKYGELVDDVFQWLYRQVGERIILCIENNSIGKAIVEHLQYHPRQKTFNYLPFIYKEDKSKELGINTNSKTKQLMIACLYQEIKENPSIVKSEDLIAQLSTIERTNSGTITSKSYSDLFMASCFCAYVRKQKSLEIMPLLKYSSEDLSKQLYSEITDAAKYCDPKTKVKEDKMKDEFLVTPESEIVNPMTGDDFAFFPIMNDDKNNDPGPGFFGF